MKKVYRNIADAIRYACSWYKSQFKGTWYQRTTATIATLFVSFFLYLGAVDINFLGLFGMSPTEECIQNPISNEASLIYSDDNVYLGKFFNENRSPVSFDEISPYVVNALISTEDERFYLHHGIDYQALFAAVKDMARGNARGASTITQQLVKNLFKIRSQYSTGLLGKVPGLRILVMKSKEWITAIKIENMLSKQDILTLYLNTVDFGSNAYGIKTAAKTYFKTTPANLTAEQAAVLVGLLKATTTYNPRVNPEKSLARRNVVLDNMLSHGMLTAQEHDSLRQLPIELRFAVEKSYDGQAQYFREAIREYLRDWCKENDYDLYSDGLKIYTTIDTRMQAYADYAVQKQMKHLQKQFNTHWHGLNPWVDERGKEIPGFIEDIARKSEYYKILDHKYEGNADSISYYMNLPHKVKLFAYGQTRNGMVEQEMSTMDSIRYMVRFLHCGFVVMEPSTAYVKAWVGDVDFDSWKYDKVTATRQPGSTFKLFVYASAFENNDSITPEYRVPDSYVGIQVPDPDHPGRMKTWAPHNANGYCTGINMPLRTAFAQSVNTVAVKLGQEIGVDRVADIAKAMGISTRLDVTPSLPLGSSDVKLIDMVAAYSTVMNDGKYHKPILVTRIEDRNGKVLFDVNGKDKPEFTQVIKYRTAYYMQQLLLGGMREHGGTSQALWQYIHSWNDTEIGGKTGTSSNHSDAWYMGCSPDLVGGAWVGGEYRSIHFRTGQYGQGSRTALPIFGYFMDKVLTDDKYQKYHKKFPQPKEEIPVINYQRHYDPAPADTDSIESVLTDDDLMPDADAVSTDEPLSQE